MKALLIPISQNAKLGPMPASIVTRDSCWPGCALFENGCYAETGPLGMFQWPRAERQGEDWSAFCAKVGDWIGPRAVWRYAQAGDLPGAGALIDREMLRQLVVANHRRPVIAFTHKPVLGDGIAAVNRRYIAGAIKGGFLISLSADSPAHADRLADLGIAPVVTMLDHGYARQTHRKRAKRRRDEWSETTAAWKDRVDTLPKYTPGGRRIAICPATYSDTTCTSCGVCARPRDVVIGFPVHGAWRRAQAALEVSAQAYGGGDVRGPAANALAI